LIHCLPVIGPDKKQLVFESPQEKIPILGIAGHKRSSLDVPGLEVNQKFLFYELPENDHKSSGKFIPVPG
jgi:hypothetical protein